MTMQHNVFSWSYFRHVYIKRSISKTFRPPPNTSILCIKNMSEKLRERRERERERRQRDKEDLPFVVPILQEALAPAFCFIPADLYPLSAKQRGPSKLCVRDVRRCKAMHCSPPRPFSTSTAMMRRLPASQCKASASLWQSVLSLSPPTSLSVFYFSHSLSAYAHLYGK